MFYPNKSDTKTCSQTVFVFSFGAGHLGRDHAAPSPEAPPDLRQQLQRRGGEAEGGGR